MRRQPEGVTVTIKDKTCIVGFGDTGYRHARPVRPQEPGRADRRSLEQALDESGIQREEIDGFCSYSMDKNDPSLLAPSLASQRQLLRHGLRRWRRRHVRRVRQARRPSSRATPMS